METGWFVFLTLLVVALTALFSYVFVRTYVDSRDASYLTTTVSVLSLTITLLCVLLIPLDIYSVSSSLNDDGTQTNLELVKNTGQGVKYLYYVLYASMVLFAFIVLPFAYFYYEEEGENTPTSARACSAAKYTFGFLIVFIVLLTIGLVIRTDKSGSEDDWKTKLSSSFNAGDAIISFVINCLAVLGMAGWIIYPSYGLANFPLNLMRGSTAVNEYSGVRSVSVRSDSDLQMELRRNTENLSYLQSQYDLTGRTWTTADRATHRKLEAEKKQLEALLSNRSINTSSHATTTRVGAFRANVSQRCATIWNATAPLRFAVAIPLLLISILLIISMFLSTLDKFLHSPCKLSCGYALSHAQLVNPIDTSLQFLNRAFPMDLIAFSGLVMYIFFATISGLVSLGVRILVFRLYSINKHATPPHAMLMATWFIMFIVLVLNQQMLTLSPQYVSFGQQFYLERSNTTGEMEHQPCTIEQSGKRDDQCRLTQIATFINTSSIQTPFFSIILFFTNLLFLAAFFIFLLYGLCRTKRSFQQERERLLDDPDMYDSE